MRCRKLWVTMPEVEKLNVESREVRNPHHNSGSLLFSNFCLHLLPLNSTYDSFWSSNFRFLTSYSWLLMPIFLLMASFVGLPFAYLRLPISYFWFWILNSDLKIVTTGPRGPESLTWVYRPKVKHLTLKPEWPLTKVKEWPWPSILTQLH